MHTHDCIHEHLPRLASQRTPQRYVAPEKAATAEGGRTAQALRIHVSAESLSSDPGRACFAEGESYSAFEGGDEYTCASADVITAAKRAILLEQLMPQATSALSRLLRVQKLDGPLVLGNARCGYGGGVPVPEAHRTVGVDADFVVYLTARPIDVGGETIAYSGHCEQDQHGRPIAAHFNWSPRHLPAQLPPAQLTSHQAGAAGRGRVTRGYMGYLVRVAMHELTHALVFSAPLLEQLTDAGGARTTARSLPLPHLTVAPYHPSQARSRG